MLDWCSGPVWQRDDLSHCFETQYIQLLFPLLTCGASLLALTWQVAHPRGISQKGPDGYERLPVVDNPRHVPIAVVDETIDSSGYEDNLLTIPHLAQTPSHPHRPSHQTISPAENAIFEAAKPKAEVALVVLEILAVGAQIIIHLFMLLTKALGEDGFSATVVGLGTWLYILVLVATRLLFSTFPQPGRPRLWNHTASLYGFQWFFATITLRSAIIHPRSRLAQGLNIGSFVLVTALVLMVLTTRRGNRCVVVAHDPGLQPSKEPLASLASRATFSWVDSLVWTGYKNNITLVDVPDLASKYKAAGLIQDFRQLKKTSRLAWHLLKYFRSLFLLQATWALVSALFIFAPTLLLKVILEYVEQPDQTPSSAAWLYVGLLFVAGCIEALSDGQALWIGRQICVRLHAVIVGEVYAKALRRKVASGGDTVLGGGPKGVSSNSLVARIRAWLKGEEKAKAQKGANSSIVDKPADTQANVGTIINLMAVDSFKVAEVSAYLHFLWASAPIEILLAIGLLYHVLGLSSVAGIGVMIILLPINIMIARGFSYYQSKIMAATDTRIHATNEVFQNIRIIKFFAWEQRFGHLVDEKRAAELKHLRNRYILWSFAATIWYGAPLIIAFLTFLIYTVVEQKDLIPSVAFTALSLFSILRAPLDQLADMLAHVQESKVSVDRVEEFLNEEETEKYSQLQHRHIDERTESFIGFDQVTCTWGGRSPPQGEESAKFTLTNVDVKFRRGELTVIVGPTGSGKTSLLMALLGEMTLLRGEIYLPGGFSREELEPDPETNLIEAVAYCAQQAWLVNDTIRQNIIFAGPVNEGRYKEVIRACALERDLDILSAGDRTLVGEKGITLSGGQKQRISLARALYSQSRHVLLDDCLSAVDSQTAKWIFEHCIMGSLMNNRTCVLVTHNVALCVPPAHHVVYVDNGRIAFQGSPEEVMSSGMLGDDMQKSKSSSKVNSRLTLQADTKLPEGNDGLGTIMSDGTANGSMNGFTATKVAKVGAASDINGDIERSEEIAVGRVKWPTIKLFLNAMGPWYYWMAAFGIFAAQQIASVATNVWIRDWANSYHVMQLRSLGRPIQYLPPFSSYNLFHSFAFPSFLSSGNAIGDLRFPSARAKKPLVPLDASSSGPNVAYYLSVYAVLVLVYMLVSMTREGTLFWGSLTASRKLHRRLLESLTRAKFSFFDSTPLGQVMNRFSKDIEAIDQEVAATALGALSCLASVISIVILVTVITPGFLIAAVFISVIYFIIGAIYIRSSRDLKRLESVQRSPLYQHFGETLSGITTIRAYGDERRFIRENLNRVNMHHRPFYFLWATNRWLAFRVDIAGALVSFFAGCFVILNVGKIDPGAAGLSLTYAVTFTENVLWLVRLYSLNEQNMNSVERIREYLEVEQEAQPSIVETRPPANWPSEGLVQFIDYSTRYRPDLEPVLKHVTFKIQPLEKVGIVGRTGAGKSSLALALFRGLEAEQGKILIDNVDIGLIGLRDLRESITIVPQDPTLFTGTIRSNLDPFGLFADEEIFTALRRVRLIDSSSNNSRPSTADTMGSQSTPANKNVFLNLSSKVTESGDNLSQGQKQLLCLARALLKQPRVILMDEATASIDYSTDAKIQETIRDLEGTIITIAHRLQTIIDYDKVLTLEKGEVREFDHPWKLLQNEDSVFRHMCEISGDYKALSEAAQKAWRAKQLVDVDD